jgi:hypothetical protein
MNVEVINPVGNEQTQEGHIVVRMIERRWSQAMNVYELAVMHRMVDHTFGFDRSRYGIKRGAAFGVSPRLLTKDSENHAALPMCESMAQRCLTSLVKKGFLLRVAFSEKGGYAYQINIKRAMEHNMALLKLKRERDGQKNDAPQEPSKMKVSKKMKSVARGGEPGSTPVYYTDPPLYSIQTPPVRCTDIREDKEREDQKEEIKLAGAATPAEHYPDPVDSPKTLRAGEVVRLWESLYLREHGKRVKLGKVEAMQVFGVYKHWRKLGRGQEFPAFLGWVMLSWSMVRATKWRKSSSAPELPTPGWFAATFNRSTLAAAYDARLKHAERMKLSGRERLIAELMDAGHTAESAELEADRREEKNLEVRRLAKLKDETQRASKSLRLQQEEFLKLQMRRNMQPVAPRRAVKHFTGRETVDESLTIPPWRDRDED